MADGAGAGPGNEPDADDASSEAAWSPQIQRGPAAAGSSGSSAARSRTPSSSAAPHELLIHPDDRPDHDADQPYGAPGSPLSRHSAFYIGFTGTLGVLLALVVGLAIR